MCVCDGLGSLSSTRGTAQAPGELSQVEWYERGEPDKQPRKRFTMIRAGERRKWGGNKCPGERKDFLSPAPRAQPRHLRTCPQIEGQLLQYATIVDCVWIRKREFRRVDRVNSQLVKRTEQENGSIRELWMFILGQHVAEEVDGVGYDESAAQRAGVALRQVRDDSQQRLHSQDDASVLEESRVARQVMQTAQSEPVGRHKCVVQINGANKQTDVFTLVMAGGWCRGRRTSIRPDLVALTR